MDETGQCWALGGGNAGYPQKNSGQNLKNFGQNSSHPFQLLPLNIASKDDIGYADIVAYVNYTVAIHVAYGTCCYV